MKKKILVYDCDGVLFDSESAVLAYYDYIMDTFELPRIDWTNHDNKYLAMISTNEVILRHFVKDEELVSRMLEHAAKLNFKKFLHLMQPEERLFEALNRLHELGYEKCVFTNRGHSLHYLLEHFELDKFFSLQLTAFDVENAKPAPDGLYKIMEHYNVTKDDLLFIGDSTNDYYAAKAADVPFVAFKHDLFGSPKIMHHEQIFDFLV